MHTIYLGLGSNIGDRERNLQTALQELNRPDLRILRVSGVYETEPLEMRAQGWFLNLVAEAETSLFPRQLLSRIAGIERRLGRKRAVPKGPRTLDIDILLYRKFVMQTDSLTIPHPRMAERRFVLQPIVDLAPEMRHPVLRKTMRELLGETTGQIVRRVDFTPVLAQME